MADIFEDGNTKRRKLIGRALREATPAQLLRVRGVIASQYGELKGYFIAYDDVLEALKLFDEGKYDHPKVCYFLVWEMRDFTAALK